MKIKQMIIISIATLSILIGVIFNIGNVQASEMTKNSINYTVQENETLQDIANRYGVTINDLENDNGLSSNSVVAGQEITINKNEKASDTAKDSKKKKTNKPKKVTTKKKKVTKKKSTMSKANIRAKKWIAQRESGGNYRARNGIYIGKYQLGSSMLKGNYSAKNQEKTADRYVKSRYGSWVNAKKHWLKFHWY
ncbi:LysM peptidoglycan-binding domain-containing protein [Lactobacillus sp. S2-2]|uniref:LysM peptidoglycan-binding domain-containing protein n=1 Tax=Lactobacillus sp. S2-2 TaxID=2692917 RepID=UPI001F3DE9D1|nr:LysM peptidoglycan-binding domain-containing protein [Lactobacillus sp. S2-2]MCF6514621.1 LysM peptidoglycan-binding domain-containing protein [Lactobacillus sp. S2-2]